LRTESISVLVDILAAYFRLAALVPRGALALRLGPAERGSSGISGGGFGGDCGGTESGCSSGESKGDSSGVVCGVSTGVLPGNSGPGPLGGACATERRRRNGEVAARRNLRASGSSPLADIAVRIRIRVSPAALGC